MTIRLSIISLAGTARTLVAVGTSSDADMFLTTAAAAPRSTCISSPSAGGGAAALAGGAEAGAVAGRSSAGGADGGGRRGRRLGYGDWCGRRGGARRRWFAGCLGPTEAVGSGL